MKKILSLFITLTIFLHTSYGYTADSSITCAEAYTIRQNNLLEKMKVLKNQNDYLKLENESQQSQQWSQGLYIAGAVSLVISFVALVTMATSGEIKKKYPEFNQQTFNQNMLITALATGGFGGASLGGAYYLNESSKKASGKISELAKIENESKEINQVIQLAYDIFVGEETDLAQEFYQSVRELSKTDQSDEEIGLKLFNYLLGHSCDPEKNMLNYSMLKLTLAASFSNDK